MRNSLINRFQPLRIIIMILYNFLINILLHFLLCRNSTKKLTHVPRNLYLQRWITLYILPPSPLHCLIYSLILITFFIRYLPDNTLKQCWFLVQINHVKTTLLHMNSKRTDVITAKQYIALSHLEYFLTVCNILAIVSPI